MNTIKKRIGIQKHSLLAKAFHWGFAILFAYGVFKQVDNIEQLEDISTLKLEIIFSLGFLFLLFLRFVYMKKTQKSSLPPDTPLPQKFAAKVIHLSLYSCLAGIALSGLLIGALFGMGIKSGVLIEMTISLHELLITLIYYLITIHVLAAIYHRFRNDGVWNSMVPFWKENKLK